MDGDYKGIIEDIEKCEYWWEYGKWWDCVDFVLLKIGVERK